MSINIKGFYIYKKLKLKKKKKDNEFHLIIIK